MAQDETYVSPEKDANGEPEFVMMSQEDFQRTGGDYTKLDQKKNDEEDGEEKASDDEGSSSSDTDPEGGSGDGDDKKDSSGGNDGDGSGEGDGGADKPDGDDGEGDKKKSGDDSGDAAEGGESKDDSQADSRKPVLFSELSDEEKNKIVEEITGGKAKDLKSFQDVLKNTETPPAPALSEEEQSMVAISRKAAEMGLSTGQALAINDFIKNMEEPKSDKEAMLQGMILEDLMNGTDPKETKENFDSWYEEKYGDTMDFMEKRNFAALANSSRKSLREMKASFSDLKLDLPENNADSQRQAQEQMRQKYTQLVDNSFTSSDIGKLTFNIDSDETISLSPENRSELKGKTQNFLQTLNERWSTENGEVDPAKVAKDLFLLENAEKLIKKAAARATVKEREALEKKRRNIADSKPNDDKGEGRNKIPRTMEDALADAKFTKVY